MADNYLERKMEDLRSGKTQKPGSRRTSAAVSAASRHPGDYTLSYPELRVFVCGDATSPLGRAIVAALREVGVKVAFSGTDKQAGEEMARSLGAQFHPLADPTDNDRLAITAAYTLRHWRGIDAVVAIGFRPAFHTPSLRTITLLPPSSTPSPAAIPLQDASAAQIACLVRLLLSPDASPLPSILEICADFAL